MNQVQQTSQGTNHLDSYIISSDAGQQPLIPEAASAITASTAAATAIAQDTLLKEPVTPPSSPPLSPRTTQVKKAEDTLTDASLCLIPSEIKALEDIADRIQTFKNRMLADKTKVTSEECLAFAHQLQDQSKSIMVLGFQAQQRATHALEAIPEEKLTGEQIKTLRDNFTDTLEKIQLENEAKAIKDFKPLYLQIENLSKQTAASGKISGEVLAAIVQDCSKYSTEMTRLSTSIQTYKERLAPEKNATIDHPPTEDQKKYLLNRLANTLDYPKNILFQKNDQTEKQSNELVEKNWKRVDVRWPAAVKMMELTQAWILKQHTNETVARELHAAAATIDVPYPASSAKEIAETTEAVKESIKHVTALKTKIQDTLKHYYELKDTIDWSLVKRDLDNLTREFDDLYISMYTTQYRERLQIEEQFKSLPIPQLPQLQVWLKDSIANRRSKDLEDFKSALTQASAEWKKLENELRTLEHMEGTKTPQTGAGWTNVWRYISNPVASWKSENTRVSPFDLAAKAPAEMLVPPTRAAVLELLRNPPKSEQVDLSQSLVVG